MVKINTVLQKGNTQASPLQSVDYTYNVRGWLKQINDPVSLGGDLFSFGINYNTTQHGGTKLYNGNISETRWRTKNDNVLRHYRYNYDALNRIKGATSWNGDYNVSSINYDKNGNIAYLARWGANNSSATSFGIIDMLSYKYKPYSNQLQSVNDGGNSNYGFKDNTSLTTQYTYDTNGNLTSDANKGIPTNGISYNHLNMPTEIKFNGSNTQKINYTYSADGIKLRKETNNGGNITTTDYAGDFVYENNTLKQFYQPEGYVEPDGSGWQYVYQYRDIWGNTRITYADDDNSGSVTSSEIRREQNYYPFGLEHKGYNINSYGAKNNLKTYQGQEFTEDLGLNTHEWKYRMSDPAIGRFWQVDPLAEDYTYNSTYAFQENKLGMGIEAEGAETIGFDLVRYFSVAKAVYHSKTSGARSKLGEAVGNRVEVLRTGRERNNASIAGYNVNQVQDVATISESLNTIGTEAKNSSKQIARDGSNALEVSGDALVVAAPFTGPAAPVVAGLGEGMSTVGTLGNITLDLAEGNVESAGERVIIEVISGGLSTLAKDSKHVDEATQRAIDANLAAYENIVIPAVKEGVKRTQDKNN